MSPSVFASFFPNTEDRGKKQKFEKAIDSLILNDPAVTAEVQKIIRQSQIFSDINFSFEPKCQLLELCHQHSARD